TMAMGRLARQEIGNAAGIYNLVRNIGGSVGIATATALLVRKGQIHQNYLAAHLGATDPFAASSAAALQAHIHAAGASPTTAHAMALGAMYRSLQQQASLMAYVDAFRLLGYLALVCAPFILMFRGVRKRPGPAISIEE